MMSETPSKTRQERVREASRLRREQEKERLRGAILEAAGDLFLEKGYADFSLRQVAERIGYTPTTIYLYFKDKDDLLAQVANAGFDLFTRALEEAACATDDPWERIEALAHAYIRFGCENAKHYRLMFLQRPDYLVALSPEARAPRRASFAVLVHAVEEAMSRGVLRHGDVEDTANTLWALVHGIVTLAVTMDDLGLPPERIAGMTNVAMRMCRDGLAV
jgi:AcrR family transcriptional regulator